MVEVPVPDRLGTVRLTVPVVTAGGVATDDEVDTIVTTVPDPMLRMVATPELLGRDGTLGRERVAVLVSRLEKDATALVLRADDAADGTLDREVTPEVGERLERVAIALLLTFTEGYGAVSEPMLLVALADDSEPKLEDVPTGEGAEVSNAVVLGLVRPVSETEEDDSGYVAREDIVELPVVNGPEPVGVAVPVEAGEGPIHWHAL